MNLAETLRDPKQRTMAIVAGVTLLIATVFIARSFMGGGGAAPPSPEVNQAVQALQNEAPPEPTAEQVQKEVQDADGPVDMAPSSGNRIKRAK